jgi:hypothetical protein
LSSRGFGIVLEVGPNSSEQCPQLFVLGPQRRGVSRVHGWTQARTSFCRPKRGARSLLNTETIFLPRRLSTRHVLGFLARKVEGRRRDAASARKPAGKAAIFIRRSERFVAPKRTPALMQGVTRVLQKPAIAPTQ